MISCLATVNACKSIGQKNQANQTYT
ncbi:hypothetical protein MJO29_003166 [Puccinia striiformis f. sp. tritici]|nr:hypothetical protein MJO29_003166 [Puccinia striiformis f. sp. tritici]